MSVPGAGVENAGPQCDVRQQIIVIVDAVKGKEHGLQPVYALLLFKLSTWFSIMSPGMHWEQPTQGDIPINADGVEMCMSWSLGFGSICRIKGTAKKQKQQQWYCWVASLIAGPVRSIHRGLEHDHAG